jgi:hypothetical protein
MNMRLIGCAMGLAVLMWTATLTLRMSRPVLRGDLPAGRTGQYVDVNRDDAATLSLLPGLGPELALRVVEHRQAYGPYASVEHLAAVRSIGPRTIERIRPWVVCGGDDVPNLSLQ